MFSNIKFIVSDMDGTLLNSKGEVHPIFFELHEKLKQRDILFCAASGRQYDSIIKKLSSIQNDIYVIAENGSNVQHQNQKLLQNTIDVSVAISAIEILRKIEDTYIVLCTENGAYIETTNESFVQLFKEYYNNYHIVDSLDEVVSKVGIYKIASYHGTSSEAYIFPFVKELEKEALLKVSGQHWLDISDNQSNKGNALQFLQKELNISKNETIVIGDYLNDLELFEQASVGFAVKNAHPKIKEIAQYETESNDNLGVERVLKAVLDSKLHSEA